MSWVSAAGFDFSNMAPASMALYRHTEYLRMDTKLKKLFGGSTEDARKIRCVPFGVNMEIGNPPMLYTMIPNLDRQGAPGAYIEKVIVRDVARFHTSKPTGDAALWEVTEQDVLSHLVGVVMASDGGANQLIIRDHPITGLPLAVPLGLARHVKMVGATTIPLESVDAGPGQNLYEIIVDFEYDLAVKAGNPRIWNLAAAGI